MKPGILPRPLPILVDGNLPSQWVSKLREVRARVDELSSSGALEGLSELEEALSFYQTRWTELKLQKVLLGAELDRMVHVCAQFTQSDDLSQHHDAELRDEVEWLKAELKELRKISQMHKEAAEADRANLLLQVKVSKAETDEQVRRTALLQAEIQRLSSCLVDKQEECVKIRETHELARAEYNSSLEFLERECESRSATAQRRFEIRIFELTEDHNARLRVAESSLECLKDEKAVLAELLGKSTARFEKLREEFDQLLETHKTTIEEFTQQLGQYKALRIDQANFELRLGLERQDRAAEFALLSQALASANQQLEGLLKEKEVLGHQLIELKKQLIAAEGWQNHHINSEDPDLLEAAAKMLELNNTVSRLKEQLTVVETDREALQKASFQAQARLEEKDRTINHLSDRLQVLTEQVVSEKQDKVELEAQITALKNAVAISEIDRLQTKTLLSETRAEMSRMAEQVRATEERYLQAIGKTESAIFTAFLRQKTARFTDQDRIEHSENLDDRPSDTEDDNI